MIPSLGCRSAYALSLALLVASSAGATSVAGLTFEELIDHSETIVTGQITRSWTDWDNEHKYIWTHYELNVTGTHKGTPGSTVVVSEPGGVVGLQGMSIAGVNVFHSGDNVLLFLQRMPNGYLRTTGWSQGKYTVDSSGRLHAESLLRGPEIVTAQQSAAASTSVRSLDGITVSDLHNRIAARIQQQRSAR